MPYINASNLSSTDKPVRVKLDYDTRTDGQPIYQGFAPFNTATTATEWLIFKYTYDVNNNMTARDVSWGAWDSRTTLTYA